MGGGLNASNPTSKNASPAASPVPSAASPSLQKQQGGSRSRSASTGEKIDTVNGQTAAIPIVGSEPTHGPQGNYGQGYYQQQNYHQHQQGFQSFRGGRGGHYQRGRGGGYQNQNQRYAYQNQMMQGGGGYQRSHGFNYNNNVSLISLVGFCFVNFIGGLWNGTWNFFIAG
jgi:hypothetical protein